MASKGHMEWWRLFLFGVCKERIRLFEITFFFTNHRYIVGKAEAVWRGCEDLKLETETFRECTRISVSFRCEVP